MANSLNITASEFPGPFEKLQKLLDLMEQKKGYKISARKLAVDSLSKGLDVLLENIKSNNQSASAG